MAINLVLACAPAQAATRVGVAVFTLFHTDKMLVRADEQCTLNGRLMPAGGVAEIARDPVLLEASSGGAAGFTLSIPGKISRSFKGSLRTKYASGAITAVVAMDIETAVAAGLAAEMPAGAGEDALAAMAVAIRSYYAAGPRHAAFDFCDTTHCQFHRSPPRADAPAMRATERTRGIVATFNGETFAPYYSAACGGRTRTPEQVGLRSGPYPYRSAACPFCAREEAAWRRDLPYDVGAELARRASEPLRLSLARSMGRSKAPPGNNYSVRREGSTLVFEGSGRGHGIGICQRGAIGMAREGVSWHAILQYYLPEAALRIMPDAGDR